MTKRRRASVLSLAVVGAAVMLLGPSARAQDIPRSVTPGSFLKTLYRVPGFLAGQKLTTQFLTVGRALAVLTSIPAPTQNLLNQIARLTGQQNSLRAQIISNIGLLNSQVARLQGQYNSLQAQKQQLLAQGRIRQAQRVGAQQGQILNLIGGVNGRILNETIVASPIR